MGPLVTVHIPEPQFNRFAASGRHNTPTKIGLDWKFPMAPVDHGQEHHPFSSTPTLQCLQGRTHGAASENHIVDKNYLASLNTGGKGCELGKTGADAPGHGRQGPSG